MLTLQTMAGNRAVSTLVLRQAVEARPDRVSRDVPGLPEHVLVRVEQHLATGSTSSAQAAVDLVVGVLAARGEIDLALLKGRRMRFDPTLTDEGRTRQWAESVAGGIRPLPSAVRIGPPALTSASWLYAAIVHEYRHAQRFQTLQSDPFKEVDAYLHNLERADEAGLDRDEVLEVWARLGDEWAEVPGSLRPLYQQRYDAAEARVRLTTGLTVLRSPDRGSAGSGPTCAPGQAVLAYEGSPGQERCLPGDDPEFRADYVDNHIVLATGLCLPGTTWATIDHASVPEILLTYADGRQLTVATSDIPLVLGSVVRRRSPMTSAHLPVTRYEKRADGFIYPVRGVGSTPQVSYVDAANLVSLRAGLHEGVEELKRLFLLIELGELFAGSIAALGSSINSLNATNRGGQFRFTARHRPGRPAAKPAPAAAQGKPSRSKAAKDPQEDDRQLTSAKDDPKKRPGGQPKRGKGEAEGEGQTAAERDWEKAQQEVRRQEAEADKAKRTEHGALREQQRGALTATELGRLGQAVPHTQGDGATARVVRQPGGDYLVQVTNPAGETVTVLRDKSGAEVRGLSERYQWSPPWNPSGQPGR